MKAMTERRREIRERKKKRKVERERGKGLRARRSKEERPMNGECGEITRTSEPNMKYIEKTMRERVKKIAIKRKR